MANRVYLTVDEVMEIHDDQIERHGGARGLRDPGQLESALHRPQTGYYADLIEEAAALWESLSQNHPFVDGNKRTAIVTTFAFLLGNGLRITASDSQRLTFVKMHYEGGTFGSDVVAEWLRANTEAI